MALRGNPAARAIGGGVELLSIELLEEHARRLAALLSTSPRGGAQQPRATCASSSDHMRALRGGLHRARRRRAPRSDVAGGRVAARQLPHRLGRRARHPARPAAVVLPAAAAHRRRRVRRTAAHLRAGARADRLERRPARRAAAAALHQRVPVGHAADDGRAVGVAERAEAGAHRAPARARRRARRDAARTGSPPIGWPMRSKRAHGAPIRGRTQMHPRVRDAPAAALAGTRRAGVARCTHELEAALAARGETIEDAIRAEGQHQAAEQAAVANLITSLRLVGDVRLERVLRERQPGRAGAAARSGRRLQPDGLPQPRPLPPRRRRAGGADRRRRSCCWR